MNAITITTRQQEIVVTRKDAIRRLARARTNDLAKNLLSAPGQATQILAMAAKIRRARMAETDPLIRPWSVRSMTALAKVYADEIAKRGGETVISAEHSGADAHLAVVDRQDGMTLLKAEGWRYYSRRFGSRYAAIAYLCGRDDNGRWAVRVPGTCTTVAEAIYAVEPSDVRKAREAGRIVLRQGDIYAIQTTKAHDGKGELPANHQWDRDARTLRHLDPDAPHQDLLIDFPVRFVAQSVMRMGRTARRGRGD